MYIALCALSCILYLPSKKSLGNAFAQYVPAVGASKTGSRFNQVSWVLRIALWSVTGMLKQQIQVHGRIQACEEL